MNLDHLFDVWLIQFRARIDRKCALAHVQTHKMGEAARRSIGQWARYHGMDKT